MIFNILKGIFKEAILYTFCSVYVRFSHFIVLPLLYKSLDVAEYNLFDKIVVFSTYLTIFTVWGLDNTYARLISSKITNKIVLNLTYVQLSLIQIILVYTTLYIANSFFNFEDSLNLIFTFCLGLTFQNIFLNYFRWNAKVKSYVYSCLFYGTLFPLVIYFLSEESFISIEKVVLVSLLLNTILFIKVLLDIKIWKNPFSFDTSTVKDVYKHSRYFGLTMVFGSLIFPLERYVLDDFISADEIQKYIIHSKLGIFISIILQSLNNTLAPLLFKSFNAGDKSRVLNIQYIYFFFNLASVLIVLLLSQYIVFFITGNENIYNQSLAILILSIYLTINLSVISDAEHQSIGKPKVLVLSNFTCISIVLISLLFIENITIYNIPLCFVFAITIKNMMNLTIASNNRLSMSLIVKNVQFFILPLFILALLY